MELGRIGWIRDMDASYENLIDQLKQQRATILLELADIAQHPRQKIGYGTHQADDGSIAFEQAADLALQHNAERLLELIEAALHRWEVGTYGYCEQCSGPIDPARLNAIPYASLCIECANHSDQVH